MHDFPVTTSLLFLGLTMTMIKVGMVGRVLAGEDAGRFVEVADDKSSSGGFLILTYDNVDRSGDAYDSWVESFPDVESYFRESRWVVEWLA
ncbi:hypothetical protein [Cellulomonas sp. Y8]|uniref:hypothetical protein n=1 Tax=Cellulomonas sp. Y8 TaxID=2591145 RepID=UPI003D709988